MNPNANITGQSLSYSDKYDLFHQWNLNVTLEGMRAFIEANSVYDSHVKLVADNGDYDTVLFMDWAEFAMKARAGERFTKAHY